MAKLPPTESGCTEYCGIILDSGMKASDPQTELARVVQSVGRGNSTEKRWMRLLEPKGQTIKRLWTS